MAAKHGARHRYNDGCRCGECKGANAAYRRALRQRRAEAAPTGPATVVSLPSNPGYGRPSVTGPVEAAVEAEIADLAEARPGMAQVAQRWLECWITPGRSRARRPRRRG